MRGSSVTRAIELIGDRWSILVVRDAFQGVRRFEDFLTRTGASRATLTRRLRSLEARGILRRVACDPLSGHGEYRLTDMGRDLFPLSLVAWSWERRWAPRGAGVPATLRHAGCGHDMRPQVVCGHCSGAVTLAEVEHRRGVGRLSRVATSPAHSWRRSALTADTQHGSHASLTHIADIVGDAWTPLIVAAAFFGQKRFDEFQQELGIATNILAARLELLVAQRILVRRLYVRHPPRHEYLLTAKGRDLFHYAVVLNAWGDRWLAPPSGPAYELVHRGCGRIVSPVVRCGHCLEPLRPDAVTYARTRRTVRRSVEHGDRTARAVGRGRHSPGIRSG
jgi:DNA-binding HxlR family transcriptional regulator